MQITFDPLNKDEADFVARIVSSSPIVLRDLSAEEKERLVSSVRSGATLEILADSVNISGSLAHADRPDVGATPEVPFAPSAAPLPPQVPAPSTAAAEVFATVPAAPTALVPPAPPVPSPPVPAAPPAASAPSAPAAAASPAPAGDLDKNGLPWDERIHAGTKAKNADGSWRQRRGLNDEGLVKRVEAELRGKVAPAASAAPLSPVAPTVMTPEMSTVLTGNGAAPVPAPPVASAPAPSAATAVVPPPPVTPAGPSVVPAPPAPAGASSAVPTAPPVAPPASTSAPMGFGELMGLITKNIAEGKLTESQVHAIMASEGVDLKPQEIGSLAADAFKRQLVADQLKQLLGM